MRLPKKRLPPRWCLFIAAPLVALLIYIPSLLGQHKTAQPTASPAPPLSPVQGSELPPPPQPILYSAWFNDLPTQPEMVQSAPVLFPSFIPDSQAATPVPEPASLALLALAAVPLILKRR